MSDTLPNDIALCGSDVVNMLERWHSQITSIAGGMDVGPGFTWMVGGGAGPATPANGESQALYDDSVSFQQKISAAVGGCNSFAASTPVLMADGTSKPIDQIKPGDKIANNLPGTDPGSKEQAHTVTAIHITYTDHDYTDVTITTPHGPATITGTAHHSYWDQTTHAWTDANHLHVGDQLQTTDGSTAIVLALRDYTTTMVTYNLTIDTLHTYYVEAGDTPVLVHNSSCGPTLSMADRADMMNSGLRAGRGGKAETTQAGLEYDKHQLNPNQVSPKRFLPRVGSRAVDLDAAGAQLLQDIIFDPAAVSEPVTGGAFSGGVRIIRPDGVGAVFDSSGDFQYFGSFTYNAP